MTRRILFEIKAGSTSGPVLKDLLFKAYELVLRLSLVLFLFQIMRFGLKDNANNAIRSMLGETLTAVQLAAVTQILSNQNLNIDSIKRLTGRFLLSKRRIPRSCIQLSVTGTIIDKVFMTASFMEISRTLDVDISFQEDNMYRRNRRLVCLIWIRLYSNQRSLMN
jgi:phosphoserine phosphatase